VQAPPGLRWNSASLLEIVPCAYKRRTTKRTRRTRGIRQLNDHRPRGRRVVGISDYEVNVFVLLVRSPDELGFDPVVLNFDRRATGRLGYESGESSKSHRAHRRRLRRPLDSPDVTIGERLDLPPLDAACRCDAGCV